MKNIILFLFVSNISMMSSYAYIMGEDNREIASEADLQNPLVRQTGIIHIPGEDFVTGLVTGDNCDVVLTAGHAAFYWADDSLRNHTRGKLRGNGKLTFSVSDADENKRNLMILVKSGYQEQSNTGDDEHDWSIFRLAAPAFEHCVNISLSGSNNTCDGELFMPAYHFDMRQSKLIDRTCAIQASLDNNVFIHDCDSKDGSSGAPIYCKINNAWHLHGINISGLTSREYEDPGIYGKRGRQFNYQTHKNYGVSIRGSFRLHLLGELNKSSNRKQHKTAGEIF